MPNVKNDYSLLEESKNLKKSAFAKIIQTELSKEKPICRWIDKDQEVQIQGLTLKKGCFYIGNYFKVKEAMPNNIKCPPKSRMIYSAVINPYLPFTEGQLKQKYFSSYYNLTENARHLYLSWLANLVPTEDVPNEILYFYIWGLQVRLFLDTETTQKHREDIINILLSIRAELNRNSIISWYINKVIDVVISKFFINEDKKFYLSDIHLSEYEYVLIRQSPEINSDKAFEIFTSVYPNHFSEYLLPHIKFYFKTKFRLRKLKIEKSEYSTFHGDITVPLRNDFDKFIPIDLNCEYPRCNINYSKTQCVKISEFFIKLIKEFRMYEKIVNDTIEPFSPLAYFSLPQIIQSKRKDIISQLRSNLNNIVDKQEVVIDYSKFSELWGLNYKGENLKMYHIDIIVSELKKLGYGIIPNYTINEKRISSKEPCVIYKQDKHVTIKVDSNFHSLELLAKLIVLVIQGSDVIDADFLLIRTILSQINENTQNLAYLNGYILWLLQKKRILDKKIKEEIESLSCSYRELFLRVLLNFTCYKGNIKSNRVEALKKLLPYFGQEENSIHTLLHQMLTGGMTILASENQSKSSPNQKREKYSVEIDVIRLKEYQQQTHESQLMLSDIFSESFSEEDINFSDNNYVVKEILSLLFTKEQWNKNELEMICKKKGLMLGSILEEINDYSYSVVGDAVLEDEGDIVNVIVDFKQDLLC